MAVPSSGSRPGARGRRGPGTQAAERGEGGRGRASSKRSSASFDRRTGARSSMARSEVFEIVEEEGPDVLLIRGGLHDVVSRVPPEAAGRSRIYIDSVGEATLVMEIRSSQSNAIYARALDRRAAGNSTYMQESNRVTNRAEVRRLGRYWGRLLRDGLDTLLTEGSGQ